MERHTIGAPQGGVVLPILSNIYLDRLDTFVETVLLPEYNRGEARRETLPTTGWSRLSDVLNDAAIGRLSRVTCAVAQAATA